MLFLRSRTSILTIALLFISLNIIYFAGLVGGNGQEILRTVKVKVSTVKESTSAMGKDVLENVKHWTLWDPLEWAEEAKVEVGDVEQDGNGIVRDPDEVVVADDQGDDKGKGNGEGKKVEVEEAGDKVAIEPVEDAVPLLSDASVLDLNGTSVDESGESTTTADVIPAAALNANEEIDDTEKDSGSNIANSKPTPAAKPTSEKEEEEDEDELPTKQEAKPDTKPSSNTPVESVKEETSEAGDGSTNQNATLTLPELCNETKWTPGLYLVCHSRCGANHTAICGGLNNARNRLQTCLRVAIDAGATLVLPRATTRKSSNNTVDGLRRVNFGSEPPDYFWDIKELKRSLLRGSRKKKGKWQPGVCSQLKVRDWDDWPVVEKGRNLDIKYRPWVQQGYTKGNFREQVDVTLQNGKLDRSKISEDKPVILNWGDPFLGWNYEQSNEMGPVRAGLFGALKFNEEMLGLADSVLDSPQLANGFIGIHLRGEKDWPKSFGSAHLQMTLYAREIKKINLRKTGKDKVTTLYVSSGSQEPINVFRDYVRVHLGKEYIVVDKWSLLENRKELLAKVEGLGFDRKAIVEYKTLVEGRYFLGIVTSTMSNLIAYARTVDQFVDTDRDFFYDVVFKGSRKRGGVYRVWKTPPKMSGSQTTKLLTLNARDIMERFP